MFFKDEDIEVVVEWNNGMPFVHLQLNKWSHTIAYRLFDLLDKVRAYVKSRGMLKLFAFNPLQDKQWKKFVEMFGFEKSFKFKGRDVYWIDT